MSESLSRKDLEDEVTSLIGDCEVGRLKNGRYIVMYMSLIAPPPPTGGTEEEAMQNFINWFKQSLPFLKPDLPELEKDSGYQD